MSKRKLLLADDSITIQKVINLTFADEGIEVITVGDGDSAMEKISQLSPDVVLADVHMPGLSGYQICEIVRENPATRNLPVVLLVGSFEPFDESEAARVGANAYLTKPFQSIRQLVSQVSDLMEAPSTEESEPSDGAEFPAPEDSDVSELAESPVTEEAASSSAAAARAPDTTDIDSLYHRSFSEPEGDYGEASPQQQHYVDAGMDDEMIETSHSSDMSAGQFTGEEDLPGKAEFETSGQINAEETAAATASVFDAGSEGLPAEASTGPSPFDSIATTEADSMEMSAGADNESYFDEFAETEQSLSIDLPPANEFAPDESDVLELPPVENGKTLEFTTTQSLMARGGGREIVSVSPELMEMIVQKVVERLSEKY